MKTLRAVQWALLGSIVLYIGLGAAVRPMQRSIEASMSYLFATLAVAVIGVIFVVRRTLVFPVEHRLAKHPDDALHLSQWRTGYIATYALCEALALFGLVQRFLGGRQQQSAPYYFGGLVLLLFFRPRRPATAESGLSA